MNIRSVESLNIQNGTVGIKISDNNKNNYVVNINLNSNSITNIIPISYKSKNIIIRTRHVYFAQHGKIYQQPKPSTKEIDSFSSLFQYLKDFANTTLLDSQIILNKNFDLEQFDIDKNEEFIFIAHNEHILKYNISKVNNYHILRGHSSEIKLFKLDYTKQYIYR